MMNSLNEKDRWMRLKTQAISIASNKNLMCRHCRLPFLSLKSEYIRFELIHNQNELAKLVCGTCEENGRLGNRRTCYYICLKCSRYNQKKHKLNHSDNCNTTTESINEPAEPDHSVNTHFTDEEMNDGSDELVTAQDDLDVGEEGFNDQINEHAGFDHIEDDHLHDEMNNVFDGFEHGDDEDFGAVEFDPVQFFSRSSLWSKEERNFFIAEHNFPGGGLKYIVWRSLFMTRSQCKQLTDNDDCMLFSSHWSRINDDQARYHLMAAITFNSLTKDKTISVCEILEEIREKQKDELDEYRLYYASAVRNVLNEQPGLTASTIDRIIEDVSRKFSLSVNERNSQQIVTKDVEEEKDVRSHYTEGPNSIIKLLPCPRSSLKTVGSCTFAYYGIEKALNHILAHSIDIYNFRAGYDEDWSSVANIPGGEGRTSKMFNHIYLEVRQMLERGEIDVGDVVVIFRIWSDGFEAHKISGHNEYNNLNVFTLRCKGKKDYIFPFALCFKKDLTTGIIVELLHEAAEMRKPQMRYWGQFRKLLRTVVLIEFVCQDYPERCMSTGLLQGSLNSRWGYSCNYNKQTPSCRTCLSGRRHLMKQRKWDEPLTIECNSCNDWWRKIISGDTYPIRIGHDTHNDTINDKNFPAVELSFELMRNGLKEAYDWSISHHKEKGAGVVLEKYLNTLCFNDKSSDLYRAIRQNKSWDEVLSLKPLLVNIPISLKKIPAVPMHLFFLGVMKTLLSQVKRVRGGTTNHELYWYDAFRSTVLQSQKDIGKLSLEWCNVMPFSGDEEKEFGVSGWHSTHCAAFARIMLYQFSCLNPNSVLTSPERNKKLIKTFVRMLVLWNCVLSNAFVTKRDGISSTRVDHLIRLFLSACKDWSKKNGESAENTFYSSTSNFFSLLNTKESLDNFGSMSHLWEGGDEAFIQTVKSQIFVVKHDRSYLKLLLDKIVRSSVSDIMKKNYVTTIRKTYARLSKLRVYTSDNTPSIILEQKDYISCLIDKDDNIFVCYERKRAEGILLYQINFDDNNGESIMNLWYSKISVGGLPTKHVADRKLLVELCMDACLLMKTKAEAGSADGRRYTVICRSWRVRLKNGKLDAMMPDEEYL